MNPARASWFRGWAYLVGFCFRRQARLRQMVGLALGLLVLAVIVVALITANFGWDRLERRLQRSDPANIAFLTGAQVIPVIEDSAYMRDMKKEYAALAVFTRWWVFFLFLGFFLPLWTLAFATNALGGERENRTLLWLASRPIPRGGIYLALYLGVLPWCVGMTVGGFAILCVAAGDVGQQALALYWPGILIGTIAFAALYHLFGALFHRPAIVGLLYAFFFETILSELPVPGTLKRLSINYYTRCIMYREAQEAGVPTESAALFVPVSPQTAWFVLWMVIIGVTVLGMWIFAKREDTDAL